MTQPETKRFLSIRLTPKEFQEVQRHLHSSACQSLTEYAKKVLTNKPVVIKVRDQSKDDILECLINIKNKLTLLEDQLPEKPDPQMTEEIKEIRITLQNIYQLCCPS
jgi:hypothetical protein